MTTALNAINFLILIFFVFSAIIYTLLLVSSVPAIISRFNEEKYSKISSLLSSKILPPITIITSIYNEDKIIKENVLSSLNSNYKNLYILLINDGSTDTTLNQLITTFNMHQVPLIIEDKIKTAKVNAIYISPEYPNLVLIDKVHSGVGDSLNVGLNACFTPYFMTVDADSILDENAVSDLMFELLSYPNTIGVGGAVYINNACVTENGKMIESKMPYRLVPALQSSEYLRSHLFNRTGWNKFGSSMSYSGTASLYRLQEVLDANGYDTENYAQDTEMVMRLHHYLHQKNSETKFKHHQIRFNPAATVWTDVPNTLLSFTKQRDRWQRGIIKSVLHYKQMILNPKYKIQGLFAFPTYILLEVIAPLVEFTAYITLTIAYLYGTLNATSAILYMLLAWGFTSYLTLANMLINLITFNRYKRPLDIMWIFLLAIIEMFGFRQYHTLVKVYATIHYFVNRLLGKSI